MKETKFKQTEIGKIPEDWEVGELKQIANFRNGKTSPKRNHNAKYYVFGSNGIIGKSDETNANPGTTIIGRVGSYCGSVYYSKDRCWVTDNAIIAEPKENSDSRYLFYLLKKMKLNRHRGGSGQPLLNQTILNGLKISLIEKPEQSAIAKILSDLDSKIELLQKQNKTLEKIGQAIFKHWFVDFEFPNEEGKPYKSSGGEMVYNEELGKEIPKGWKVGELGDFIKIDKGLSYKGKFLCEKEEGIPLINLGNIAPQFGFIHETIKYYNGEFKDRHLVKPGDIVIANTDITQRREVLGSPAIVPSDLESEKILFTHHIYAVRNKSLLPNIFLYYLLQLNGYRGRVRGFATGTTVLALPRDVILNFEFAIPSPSILNLFTNIISQIQKKIDNNNFQKESLSQIRDTLLPKLMSGEVRVNVPKMEEKP